VATGATSLDGSGAAALLTTATFGGGSGLTRATGASSTGATEGAARAAFQLVACVERERVGRERERERERKAG